MLSGELKKRLRSVSKKLHKSMDRSQELDIIAAKFGEVEELLRSSLEGIKARSIAKYVAKDAVAKEQEAQEKEAAAEKAIEVADEAQLEAKAAAEAADIAKIAAGGGTKKRTSKRRTAA